MVLDPRPLGTVAVWNMLTPLLPRLQIGDSHNVSRRGTSAVLALYSRSSAVPEVIFLVSLSLGDETLPEAPQQQALRNDATPENLGTCGKASL